MIKTRELQKLKVIPKTSKIKSIHKHFRRIFDNQECMTNKWCNLEEAQELSLILTEVDQAEDSFLSFSKYNYLHFQKQG